MTYNPAIPQSTDLISNSQPSILTNFSQLNTIFDFNHFTWNDATTANRGLHRKIDFPTPTTVSSPSGNDSVVYPKTVSGATELVFDNASKSMQITNSALTTTSGQGMMPGGLQVRCATGTSSSGGTTNTFSTAFPTACLSVVASSKDTSPHATGYIISINIIDRTSFTAYSTVGTIDIYYIAVGY